MKRFIIICLLSPALLIAQNNFPKLGDEYEGGKVFSIDGQEIFIADLSQKDKLTYAKANNKFNKPNSYNYWHLPKAHQLSRIQRVLNLHLWDKKFWSSDSIQSNSSLRKIIDFETGNSEWITKSSSAKAYFIPIRRTIYGDKKGLTINEKVRLYVESEIIEWQQKGEFEKTTDYLVRIESRDNKIEELEKIAIDSLKEAYAESIRFDDIYMNKYDADNEVFLFHSPQLGEIPLYVPLIHAKEFKDLQNKDKLRYNNPQFVQFDGKFILSHLEICMEVHEDEHLKRIEETDDSRIIEYSENSNSAEIFKANRTLVRVINMLGDDVVPSEYNEDEVLLHLYNDGSVEKMRCFKYDIENESKYELTEIEYNFAEIKTDIYNEISSNNLLKTKKNKISLGSKVDVNIPKNAKVNNRYALIFGNEDYSSYQYGLNSEQNVAFAENDAKIFKEYALNTLGVKEDNLYFKVNATAGQMKRDINLVSEIINEIGEEAELIFYYAGHGYPDELTKVPYLIPVDITANDLSHAISLSNLYNTLSKTKAKRITMFLDACFTGGARGQELVASRGIKISPKQEDLDGNLVVISASSETQSSLPYFEQAHGMFTYFLLDKLQKSKGSCSYGELYDYLDQEVPLNSLKINHKKQNPQANTSQNVLTLWRKWTF